MVLDDKCFTVDVLEFSYLSTCAFFQGFTPLILAVMGGHLSCVKMLVAAGALVDQPDGTSGRTPLHHVVEADNVAIAGHLLLEVIILFNCEKFVKTCHHHAACFMFL